MPAHRAVRDRWNYSIDGTIPSISTLGSGNEVELSVAENGMLIESGEKAKVGADGKMTKSHCVYTPVSKIIATFSFDNKPSISIPLLLVHKGIYAKWQYYHEPFSLEGEEIGRFGDVIKMKVDLKSLAKTIALISKDWTIDSVGSKGMSKGVSKGRIELSCSKSIDGLSTSIDIGLAGTGGGNPIIQGGMMYMNFRVASVSTSMNIVALSGGGGSTETLIGNFKSKGLVYDFGPSGHAIVCENLDIIARAIYDAAWGTPGWQLATVTSSVGGRQGTPLPSVPLRLVFSNLATGQHITLHVVVRADGSLRVNWQAGRSDIVGPPVYNIPGDKASGERLPQWWNPAVIEKEDGTERYKVDPTAPGKTTMLEAFLADIPFEIPRHPPVVKK